jgi:hypothetical protein
MRLVEDNIVSLRYQKKLCVSITYIYFGLGWGGSMRMGVPPLFSLPFHRFSKHKKKGLP